MPDLPAELMQSAGMSIHDDLTIAAESYGTPLAQVNIEQGMRL